MTKILFGDNNISRILIRFMRKYSEGCKGKTSPDYDCPHKKTWEAAEKRELRRKANVHPFLRKECKHNPELWKKIFFFICVPSLIAAVLNVKYVQPEPKRPPYVDYPYLRIRTKNFPWKDGNKTLFHNPKKNALPGGYETDLEDEDD